MTWHGLLGCRSLTLGGSDLGARPGLTAKLTPRWRWLGEASRWLGCSGPASRCSAWSPIRPGSAVSHRGPGRAMCTAGHQDRRDHGACGPWWEPRRLLPADVPSGSASAQHEEEADIATKGSEPSPAWRYHTQLGELGGRERTAPPNGADDRAAAVFRRPWDEHVRRTATKACGWECGWRGLALAGVGRWRFDGLCGANGAPGCPGRPQAQRRNCDRVLMQISRCVTQADRSILVAWTAESRP